MQNSKSISYQLSANSRPGGAAISGQQTVKLLQTSLLRKLFTVHYSLFTNKKGMTLVEVLIAMVVLLLVFLALMQTALVSIDSNMRNALRDEAVSIAEQKMNEVRDLPFTSTTDSLTTASDAAAPNTNGCFGGAPCPANFPATGQAIENARNFRNITNFCFCTNKTVTSLATDTRQVLITVGWKWKGIDNPLYTISTVVRKQ